MFDKLRKKKDNQADKKTEAWGDFKFLMVDGKEFAPTTIYFKSQTGVNESMVVLARVDD